MTILARRAYHRHTNHVPILYAGWNSKSYRKAVMFNSGPDGMYFESDSPLQAKFDLYIKVRRHRPPVFNSERYKAFRARVKWCRQLADGKIPRFGIGVQYTAKSNLLYGINLLNSGHLCDCCEKSGINRLIHQTESGLILCQDCLHNLESFPNKMEEVTERFLIGNVV